MAESWPQVIDGTTYWVTKNDDGTYSKTPTGGGGGGGGTPNIVPSGGGQVFQTREGPKTVAQMQAELRAAGGNPPSDPAAVFQMYQGIAGGGAAAGGDWSKLWGAMGDTNQQNFDWEKEKYGKTLTEQQREYDLTHGEQKRQFDTSSYSNLAQALLNGATSLRGPQDWLKYANYTNGGQNIFKALYGNQAAPTFSAPGGNSQPANIQQLLADLGLGTAGGGAGTTLAPSSQWYTPLYDWFAKASAAGQPTGQEPWVQRWQTLTGGSPDAGNALWQRGTDYWRQFGKLPTAEQYQQWQGQLAQPTQTSPTSQALQQATAPVTGQPQQQNWLMGEGDRSIGLMPGGQRLTEPGQAGIGLMPGGQQLTVPSTGGASQQGTDVMTPLPHQINPAVWDSLSQTAKTMILASAEAGKTPSGAWSADDFLSQLNAARPQGTAPRRTQMSWGSQSLF
jgi:hypothetical protein